VSLRFTDGHLYIDHYRASIFAFWYFAQVTFYSFFTISVLHLHTGHGTWQYASCLSRQFYLYCDWGCSMICSVWNSSEMTFANFCLLAVNVIIHVIISWKVISVKLRQTFYVLKLCYLIQPLLATHCTFWLSSVLIACCCMVGLNYYWCHP